MRPHQDMLNLTSESMTQDPERGCFGRGDDTVGNPHRITFLKIEFFEFILLLKLDNQLSMSHQRVHDAGPGAGTFMSCICHY